MSLECKLLDAEKSKNEMNVDLMQLQQQVTSLSIELKNEVEKVSCASQRKIQAYSLVCICGNQLE